MNLVELSAKVAEEARLTKSDAEEAVRAAFLAIGEALKNGEEVKIAGFGSFVVKTRVAREGLNPSTKEKIVIPASKVVGFKVAKHLKEDVK